MIGRREMDEIPEGVASLIWQASVAWKMGKRGDAVRLLHAAVEACPGLPETVHLAHRAATMRDYEALAGWIACLDEMLCEDTPVSWPGSLRPRLTERLAADNELWRLVGSYATACYMRPALHVAPADEEECRRLRGELVHRIADLVLEEIEHEEE